MIGGIGLRPGSDTQSHTGEVGYWLAEEHQGKRMMIEALDGFVHWAFTQRDGDGSAPAQGTPPETKKTKLFAEVFAGNTTSMHILERCGFQKEGVQKDQVVTRYGEVTDLHLYGLTLKDWKTWRDGEGREI